MDLNPRQQEAVDYGTGPLLIVAGAGSGKTRTLTSRLIKLIQNGVPAANIIAITFTNKAAQEMKARVNQLIGELVNWEDGNKKNQLTNQPTNQVTPFIGTFHSLGARILKREAQSLGRTPAFTIFDEDDSLSTIKNVLKELNLSKGDWSPFRAKDMIGRIKNELLDPDLELDKTELSIWSAYEDALVKCNAFDFDDLIQKVVRLYLKHPETLEKYRRLFRYILVDEYQDINTAQYQLIKLLALNHQNLSVVGDDAQSIYKFRGSDFRNFLNFEADWPKAKIVLLEENYRSTQNIITAASELIKNNKFQRPKNLWTRNPSGDLIKVVAALDAETEADFIAERVNQLISELVTLEKSNKKNQLTNQLINQSPSIAVLYRTNAQSRALESALIKNQIPYKIFGGVKFYERKEIKDIVAGLRLALNPKDRVSAERLDKAFPKPVSRHLINELPKLGSKLSLLELINFFIINSRYFDYLGQKFKNSGERIENINELIAFAGEFSSLAEFLERVALFQSTDIAANRKGQIANRKNERLALSDSRFAVELMTIHMAKGLEFNSVFVAGSNEGLLPHQMSYGTLNELEEERRLMYVAMTRAKQNLWLSFYDLPSRFLYELPPELTEFTNLTGDSKELPDAEAIYIE